MPAEVEYPDEPVVDFLSFDVGPPECSAELCDRRR